MFRAWINQPSTLQQHHELHGVNVLAVAERAGVVRVYFLSGDIISMEMLTNQISLGWK